MKNILIGLLFCCSTFTYAGNSDSPKTIPIGKKAIEANIKGHIFWVESEDGKQYRHRVINYHDFKYHVDEGFSHNYLITLTLKDIDDGDPLTLDCETSINYYYLDKEINYPDDIHFRWCKINDF